VIEIMQRNRALHHHLKGQYRRRLTTGGGTRVR
jgi:hypothetical protein